MLCVAVTCCRVRQCSILESIEAVKRRMGGVGDMYMDRAGGIYGFCMMTQLFRSSIWLAVRLRQCFWKWSNFEAGAGFPWRGGGEGQGSLEVIW